MGYRAEIQAPLSIAGAEELGRWIAQYAIHVSSLRVLHLVNGRWVEDHPTARTVAHFAGSYAIATPVSSAGGAAAAALGCTLAPAVAIPLLIADVIAQVGMFKFMTWAGRRAPHPKAERSRVEFGLTDVSDKRRAWAELLLAIYAIRHGWRLTGLQHPEQLAAAAGYVSRHDGYPTPWGQLQGRPQPGRRQDPGRRSAGSTLGEWLW